MSAEARIDEHDHRRVDRWVRFVLVWGMVLSVSVMVLGLFLYVLLPTGHPEVDLSLGDIVSGIAEGNPIAVIDLGIVMLIATPLTRVVTSLIVFAVDREPRFVAVSLLVLGIITLAILIG